MTKNTYEKYDDKLYPLSDKFEIVNELNFLQFAQIAIIQYNFILHNKSFTGYHLVNWRVNFANLQEYVKLNQKSSDCIINFLKLYENSAPLLYKMLGLEY